MPDLTGELIDGRYQLNKLIASGGMASIYAGVDLRLDRPVAVKIMHEHLANDEEFVTRFIREAKATAALNHPNVVAIQDQGWNTGGVQAVFIVMEYIEGFTLRDMLHERGRLSIDETLKVIVPVLNALNAAHQIGIIHRDIKPENILIASDGRIKVADFGLARGIGIGSTMTAEASVILGSVSYLSPEQVQRGISDARSDVYSVGIMLFEMLTGKKPFEGESPIQIAYKHVNEKVPAPSSLIEKIPPALDELVLQATAVNPDDRPANAGALLTTIKAIQISLDPKKSQLSLELDIPPTATKNERKTRPRVEVGIGSPATATTQMPALWRRDISTTETSSLTRGKREDSVATPKPVKRKKSARVIRNRIIFILGLFIIAGAAWYQFASGTSGVSVPSIVGLSQRQALAQLSPLGLHQDVVQRVFSEDVPSGLIISSQPGGGGHIAAGGTVHLTVSKGKDRSLVPAVNGMTSDAATTSIVSAGLKLGTISTQFDVSTPKGLVVSADPASGTQVRPGSLVNLIVSNGPETVAATNYVGQSGDQALNELTAAGFSVTSTYAYSDTVPAGAVIKQTPDPTQPLPKGAAIALVISQGPQNVFVPNVAGLSQLDATRLLENLQLQVTVKSLNTKKNQTVINVSPAIGTQVTRGSTVVLTVG